LGLTFWCVCKCIAIWTKNRLITKNTIIAQIAIVHKFFVPSRQWPPSQQTISSSSSSRCILNGWYRRGGMSRFRVIFRWLIAVCISLWFQLSFPGIIPQSLWLNSGRFSTSGRTSTSS
jgi:hypothetical protein